MSWPMGVRADGIPRGCQDNQPPHSWESHYHFSIIFSLFNTITMWNMYACTRWRPLTTVRSLRVLYWESFADYIKLLHTPEMTFIVLPCTHTIAIFKKWPESVVFSMANSVIFEIPLDRSLAQSGLFSSFDYYNPPYWATGNHYTHLTP